MSMGLGLKSRLRLLVELRYQTIKGTKELTFSETELSYVTDQHGISVRFCPALSSKPVSFKDDSSTSSSPDKKFDPFANPPPALLVSPVPGNSEATHNIVLNKYPVIANHFILATKEYAEQDALLEPADLALTLDILREWNKGFYIRIGQDREDPSVVPRVFAFFNSGKHSGASQSHRHIQFLPVADVRAGKSDWRLLIDQLDDVNHACDFAVFSTKLPPTPTPSQLLDIYMDLHKTAEKASQLDEGESMSYNLALTTERMAICPRRAEAAEVGTEGLCSINGTLLAGTLMVRTKEQYELLRGPAGSGVLSDILGKVGYKRPKSSEKL